MCTSISDYILYCCCNYSTHYCLDKPVNFKAQMIFKFVIRQSSSPPPHYEFRGASMGFLRTKHASEIYYGWRNYRRRMFQMFTHRRRTVLKRQRHNCLNLLFATYSNRSQQEKKYDRFNRNKTLRESRFQLFR
jgi:hypothetical protein